MQTVATYLGCLGRHEEAQKLRAQSLKGLGRSLGNDHPDTLKASMNLAGDLEREEKLDEAHCTSRCWMLNAARWDPTTPTR